MRRAARLALVPLPFVFLGQISGQPAPLGLPPGTSLNIKPVLSEDDAYDAIIGSEGGTRLSIRPPQSLPAAEVTPFEYGGQGENMYLTRYRMEGDRVVVFLDHFSGAGFTLSTPQERAVQLARAPLDSCHIRAIQRPRQRAATICSEIADRKNCECTK